ncbi:hypothetical protein ACFL3E_02255, partial [Patescibacteria group bacterium]
FIGLGAWATTIGTNIDATGTIGAATSTPWGTLAAEQTATQGKIDPTFVVGDAGTTTPFIFVSPKGVVSFGSTTPAAALLNPGDVVVGRGAGSLNDVYISGALGIGNATTGNSELLIGNYVLSVFENSNIGMFGTSAPIIADGLSIGGAAGTHADVYVSGGLGVGNATTSDGDFVVGNDFSVTANGNTIVGAPTTSISMFTVDGGNMTLSSGGTGTTTLSIMTEAAADGENSCIEMSNDGITYTLMIDGAGTGVLVSAGDCDS